MKEGEPSPSFYRGVGGSPRGGAPSHGGAPTSSLFMWVEAPLTPTHAPINSHLENPKVFL